MYTAVGVDKGVGAFVALFTESCEFLVACELVLGDKAVFCGKTVLRGFKLGFAAVIRGVRELIVFRAVKYLD